MRLLIFTLLLAIALPSQANLDAERLDKQQQQAEQTLQRLKKDKQQLENKLDTRSQQIETQRQLLHRLQQQIRQLKNQGAQERALPDTAPPPREPGAPAPDNQPHRHLGTGRSRARQLTTPTASKELAQQVTTLIRQQPRLHRQTVVIKALLRQL